MYRQYRLHTDFAWHAIYMIQKSILYIYIHTHGNMYIYITYKDGCECYKESPLSIRYHTQFCIIYAMDPWNEGVWISAAFPYVCCWHLLMAFTTTLGRGTMPLLLVDDTMHGVWRPQQMEIARSTLAFLPLKWKWWGVVGQAIYI